MTNLNKKVQNFAHKNGLFKQNQKILVGVSGGADSVCLLSLLKKLSKKYEFSLHIAHVNYGLRGKDSDKDEDFVIKLAKKEGVRVTVFKPDKARKVSEETLRGIRYDFFEKNRKELKFDSIAVAHNMDDQAETVLMRILRGSGLQGLSSMKPANGNIIRPLLSCSREEIVRYLKKEGLTYRKDKTNAQPIFMRNKVRLKLIPYLENNFNPKVKDVLASLATSASDDYDFISEITKKECKKAFLDSGTAKKEMQLSIKHLEGRHNSVLRLCLRSAIKSVKEDLINIEVSHIEEIIKIIRSKKGKNQKTSFKGLNVERKGDILSLYCSK